MTIIKNILWILLISLMTACVPSSKFQNLKENTDKQIKELKKENHKLKVANNELEYKVEKLNKEVIALKDDTTTLGRKFRNLQEDYDKLERLYDLQKQKDASKQDRKSKEMKNLLEELQVLKDDLLKREDSLNVLQDNLREKEERLNDLQNRLENKEDRLLQLESVLQRQDSIVAALRDKVSDALLGFEGEGLTVEQKDGKVYLSLEEKLLFESGSWQVESRGREAISKIARLLEKNTDIRVMIEGHTDDVPYRGSGKIKDNWDLSVKRATSIVRIIIDKSNVDPARLTAAGRSKYVPLAGNETAEGRRKNRRTEIILTPDLSKLFDIIGQSK
ncbi:MAG: OmpA family protein [Bacteroidales bacterium]|nr:OmpA family protein [Bacteroidales bacterium]MCF8339114.1 OmpA family protein [Bacteroidales bacterium]